ncbi:hypothetical protein [Flavobacterium sp. LM4]|uniref:hypothetical protein n=1 Tax=Flavobacterium sp. LM4 TaxID=1938609 RepID=UPI0009927B51|nr:hypothetical protein [Flavobacterium sp. LM4]OOV19126.1 hypothetical protein BXU10_05495 [Flavobacterium sp. LM4]
MAVTEKNILKNWFLNGLKPPQEQFWAWQDSYFHKYDLIPPASIEGFTELLSEKADKEAFDNHLEAADAHPEAIKKARIIPSDEMVVFKAPGNENNEIKEVGDYCIGIVENTKIEGIYVGGDDNLLDGYEIYSQLEF